jgi:subtilase family serine protease
MKRRAFVFTTAAVTAGLACALALAGPAMALTSGGTAGSSELSACSDGQHAGTAVSCNAIQLENTSAWRGSHTTKAGVVEPTGYGPAQLQQAYDLTAGSAADGRGRTVAIVDANDDPFALSNLSTYRAQWGLPPICGFGYSRGCVTFTKVNQSGRPWPLPSPDPDWAQEISVDLDMVSAICPNCNILLVEADDATPQNLARAEDTAAAAHPVSIGNSFGIDESNSDLFGDTSFDHPGIAITAAAGDDGYGVEWPASSPNVIAVGGTTLSPASGPGRTWSETAWSGVSSGCSAVEPQPNWQSKVAAIRTVCSRRAVADVAAVADPDTGVAVYDTFGLPGWSIFGGTSVATQIISAMYGLAGGNVPPGASGLYAAPAGDFYDVTSGSDGTCGSDLCTAGVGWDGPTGLGTPDGTAAF